VHVRQWLEPSTSISMPVCVMCTCVCMCLMYVCAREVVTYYFPALILMPLRDCV
jgi:hypothetical protein